MSQEVAPGLCGRGILSRSPSEVSQKRVSRTCNPHLEGTWPGHSGRCGHRMKKADFARTNPPPVPKIVTGPTHRTTAELKLRKGAGRHYATQYILAENSRVFLLRTNGLWASVQHGQTFGWLPAQCLERLPATASTAPPVQVRTSNPVTAPQRAFTPHSASSPAEPADEEFHPTHRSTADLNLRKGSGTNYPVLQVLPTQQLVRKLDEAGTWTKISTGPAAGWVPSAYLTQVNFKRPATGIQAQSPAEYTTTVRLNVRKGTGDQYPVMRILQAGTLVRVNGSVGDWRRIVLEHDHGWVPASQLQARHITAETLTTVVSTTMHQGASANYRVLAQMGAGEKLQVLDARGQWAKVRHRHVEGWINTSHTDEKHR